MTPGRAYLPHEAPLAREVGGPGPEAVMEHGLEGSAQCSPPAQQQAGCTLGVAFPGVSVPQLTFLVLRQPTRWLGLVSFSSGGAEAWTAQCTCLVD